MQKLISFLSFVAALVAVVAFFQDKQINRYTGQVVEGWFLGGELLYGRSLSQAQPKSYPDGWYWEADGADNVPMVPQPAFERRIHQQSGEIAEGFFFGARLLQGQRIGQAVSSRFPDGRVYWVAPNDPSLQPVPVI
jgi:hypothetical protein